MQLENCDLAAISLGVVILQGGPGTGKTFLLEKMKRTADESGSLCLSVTGFRDEREIPFSSVEQLVHDPGVPDAVKSAVWRLIRQARTGGPDTTVPVRLVHDLASALVAAAGRTRIVVLVDDAQHMDPSSQSCLLYLARRVHTYGIAMVLACPRVFGDGTGDHLEFAALPGARLVEAANLPVEGVRSLLEGKVGADAARGLAAPVHRISGGNPALTTALVRDLAPSAAARTGTNVPVGDGFRTTYLAGLVRHPSLARTVQAWAVLGDDATAARAARLLERRPGEIEQHLSDLERAGLLGAGRFRHPTLPNTVLGAVGAELPALHRKAATLLLAEGAPALTVARQLVAADERPDPSQARLLQHAGKQLLVGGHVDRAIACLRLAGRADLGDEERGKALAALIGALCYVNPLAATEEVDRLLAAARAGHVDRRSLQLLVAWFLWFGWRDHAREVMTRLVASVGPPQGPEGVRGLNALIGCLWPDLLNEPSIRGYFREAGDVPALVPPDAREPAPEGADNDATGARSTPAVTDPRRFWGLDLAAVTEVLQKGELTRADRLCEEQRRRAPVAGLPARQAFFAGLRAHIRWNLGDLRTAVACAASALALLPDHSWGVTVGLPLSALIAAYTLMGVPHHAAGYLERPVPDEMWDSAFGPLYRVARGSYLLETGRPREALNDFAACAPRGEAQHVDLLGPLGWRAHAAEAYLALGEPDQARGMAFAELAQDDRPTDARGRALQILATVDEPALRRARLEEAEHTLRKAGSRLSLAKVLARLSRADLEEGRTHAARTRHNEALHLADECGAPHRSLRSASSLDGHADPAEPIHPDVDHRRTSPGPDSAATDTTATGSLTEAEWRVASLAATGRSNRQIASRLFITVSTVEQHLTRVYRKLAVRRRGDLSLLLGLQTQE
ncbi:LuxR C-terminal-related transcriptional regulator [Streptomyces sp. SID13726]|uniref:helix-turn-helix transcriptional regulator n=1 Tax=Streptomyces sp. SID13726 TaxID=2706058 RepID=UPI0013B79597|nr:LuxR C-terminal-related transcriptional regulator [Streptomyces sp. SID13726]NEB03376.1 AAA family ATPase [Streptomyces sp. SID13726]